MGIYIIDELSINKSTTIVGEDDRFTYFQTSINGHVIRHVRDKITFPSISYREKLMKIKKIEEIYKDHIQ